MDLHIHTPKSHDFNQPKKCDNVWVDWLEAAARKGLHAVAITDHNTASAIKEIQAASERVPNSPIIFPGVEITASNGVHLLAIMDPECKQSHIESLLTKAEIQVGQRGAAEARSSMSVESLLEGLSKDAIILGAHVNCKRGILRECEGQERIGVLRNVNLAAVEWNPDVDHECSLNAGGDLNSDHSWLNGSRHEIGRPISQVWASDAHRIEDIGQRATWVKMTRPNREGLRLALLDGPDSLQTTTHNEESDPNQIRGDLTIERITVNGAQFMGRKAPFDIELNPWFNAIIGGRGTGKSTIVDFCRRTLRRDEELGTIDDHSAEGSLRQMFNRRLRVPPSREQEGLLTEDTSLAVVYQKNGDRFELTWDQDGAKHAISRLDGENRVHEEGSIMERFPVRIYSQKQLFAIAQDPDALLSIIDDSLRVQASEKNREIKQLRSKYLSLQAQAREAKTVASDLGARQAEYDDVERKLKSLQEGGLVQQLSAYRKNRRLQDTWNALVSDAQTAVREVVSAAEQLEVADFDSDSFLDGKKGASQHSLVRAHEALNQQMQSLKLEILQSVKNTQRTIESIESSEDIRAWQRLLKKNEEDFHLASAKLDSLGIRDPSEITDLVARSGKLSREIESLKLEEKKALNLADDARQVLGQYREKCEELGKARAEFAEEATDSITRIRVSPFSSHKRLSAAITEVLGTERFAFDREQLAEEIKSQSTSWNWEDLDAVLLKIKEFQSGNEESWR